MKNMKNMKKTISNKLKLCQGPFDSETVEYLTDGGLI